ncbi:MAG: dihydrofolate reductase [Rhodobiaceae bacterium]|jgi:dihydrofolate reductase|nr:dihydrofolate reductase [Rhodobiaceae bacterium]MBT6222839.1 dihydrofolate reductase [Rhodobiaceae bacterium]
MKVDISIILARSSNNVIGHKNKLPWNIPGDLKYYKKVTMGKPIIMGRITHESIGKVLPGRLNIIVTKNHNYKKDDCIVVNTVDQALAVAKEFVKKNKLHEIFVIGGVQIYKSTMEDATKVYLTEVHKDYEGDKVIDSFDSNEWKEISRTYNAKSINEDSDYSFVILKRIKA